MKLLTRRRERQHQRRPDTWREAHGLNRAEDVEEPEREIPVPPQAGAELPEIAEALLRGPLQRSGQFDAARRANELLAARRVDEAVGVMRRVAESLLQAGSLTLAERYREWAASSFEHAGRPRQGAQLLIDVAYGQALCTNGRFNRRR